MTEEDTKPKQDESQVVTNDTAPVLPPKEEPKKQVLSVKEIDELYEEIKQASKTNDNDPDREKDLVKKAIEAERKRIAQEESVRKEQEEKQQMKSELESMKAELESLKNTSGGRRTEVPQSNPFSKSESGQMRIPKETFDASARKFILGK